MDYRFLNILMFSLSLSGVLTAFFIIGSYELTAVFLGWLFVSIVSILIYSARRVISNPEVLIDSYRNLVQQIVEEFNLYDVSPYYIPSKFTSKPSLYIPAGADIKCGSFPSRVLVMSDNLGLRLEVLGSYLVSELGGVANGLSSAEAFLKSVLSTYLEIARDVELQEVGDKSYLIRIRKGVQKYLDDPPAVNIYSQIVGPVLSEALGEIVRIEGIRRERSDLYMTFRSFEC